MKLHETLGLCRTDTVAIIGAGGKTTALWRLAEERRDTGEAALVTTSTHIMIPAENAHDAFVSPDTVEALLAACAPGKSVCAGFPCGNGKCTGLSPAVFAAAQAAGLHPLYEADGAARLPAKLHREGEPVIHPNTDKVLLVAGLRALGRPVGEVCHRFALSPRMAEDPTRLFDEGDLLETIHDGIRASGVSPDRLRILINQADTPNLLERAIPLQGTLHREGYFVKIGCLRSPFWP